MKYVEIPASPENLSRVDLSFNGVDMGCAYGDPGMMPRCEDAPAVIFFAGGFLWPACNSHRAELEHTLSTAPEALAVRRE